VGKNETERKSNGETEIEKEKERNREQARTPATASKVEKRVIEERDRDGERTKKRQTEEGASK